MPRKSLRPHLNQIRAWVRQGRTDAWIAHQLEVSVRDIEQFKRTNDLGGEDALSEGSISTEYPEEIDLRAEDDALIAAELEAAEIAAERARAALGRVAVAMTRISAGDFNYIRDLVRVHSALLLEPGKEYLVESRLGPVVSHLG